MNPTNLLLADGRHNDLVDTRKRFIDKSHTYTVERT